MVTTGRSYFLTLRNACVTAGKTTRTAGKICHGCFEMLSWPHCTSNNNINICFWLLETCTKCSYFIEENIRPGTQRLAFEVRVYLTPVHEHTVGRRSALGQVSGQPALDVSCLAQAHNSDNTGRFQESDHTIRNRRFQNIALRHRSRVHICISKSNYRKISCLGEHNTQGTSTPWVNKQGNYRICL